MHMSKKHDIPIEVELKLEVEPDKLDEVVAHPELKAYAPNAARQDLHSTYFDTPSHDLKQAGISFRIRRNGTRRVQTIKAARISHNVALARNEWEHEVDSDDPDFALAKGTALEPFLNLQYRIRPVFTVTADRTLLVVRHGQSIIEVAADRGRVEGADRDLTFGELELELKEGTVADLFALAVTLSEAAPLRLSYRTKAQRGYDATSDEKPTKVKSGSVKLKRRMTSAEAFQIIGASCLKHMMANEMIVRERLESDAIHQMRVALRRLRAAITLFKAIVADEERDEIRSELRWMANGLGEARDLDVYIAKILKPALISWDEDAGLNALLQEAQERRAQAYGKVQEIVASSRLVNGVLKTAAWIQAGAWAQDESKPARKRRALRISVLAEEELDRRWKRILKRGKRLADLDPEDRHQVRIEIKKLRYAAEFFESLFKGQGTKARKQAALATLEALQETLGDLNDIAVGAQLHGSVAAEALHEEQLARVDDLLAKAMTQYRDLASLEPFWKG